MFQEDVVHDTSKEELPESKIEADSTTPIREPERYDQKVIFSLLYIFT